MSKAKKPDTTLSESERAIKQRLREEYELDRWRWLNGAKPFVPDPVATIRARALTADSGATVTPKPKRKLGPKERIIIEIARTLPHEGRKLDDTAFVKKVGDLYQKQTGRTIHRTTILRAAGRLSR